MGEKARMINSRVSINGDVYYENWSNIQQEVAPACGFKFTTNAGKAEVYGVELEVGVILAPGLSISQNGGFTHATNSTTLPLAGVVAGQRLLDVPEFTANTTLSYKYPLDNSLNLIARATNTYVDSIQDLTYGRNSLPPYDLVGARTGLETDRWSAVLFVDNATDKIAYLGDTGALSANISILNRVTTNQPRTIGVDLNFKF